MAPGVASEIVTFCTVEYTPDAGEMVGVAGAGGRPTVYVAVATLLLR